MAFIEKLLDSTTSLNNVFYPLFLSTVVVLILYIAKKLDRSAFRKQGIPELKMRFYDVLGHISLLPRGPAYDRLFPPNVYLLQLMEGLRTLFGRQSFSILWMLHRPFVLLHKADAVEALLNSSTLLGKAWSYNMLHPWLGTGLLTSQGSKWKSRRKLLTPSFHFDILKEFLPVINEKSQILVGVLKDATNKEWIDIVKPVTLCSLDIICETTLGVNIEAQTHEDSEYVKAIFRVSTTTMSRMFNPAQWVDFLFYLSKTGRQLKKDTKILHTFTENVIKKKKSLLKKSAESNQDGVQRKRKALMDLLLDHHMNYDDLTEHDIREEVDTFAFEGHDTTSMGLSWALYLIGLHPQVQKNIHDELDRILVEDVLHVTNEDLKRMKYLECVIKEAQRIYPSVPMVGREIAKDSTFKGFTVPKGSTITVNIYGLHRDPEVFPNPEIFDPDRFLPENAVGRHPYAYVPFSAGPRNCIGQRFAMMELKIVLATVLRHYKMQSLDPRDQLIPAVELILRPSRRVKMKIMSRKQTNA